MTYPELSEVRQSLARRLVSLRRRARACCANCRGAATPRAGFRRAVTWRFSSSLVRSSSYFWSHGTLAGNAAAPCFVTAR